MRLRADVKGASGKTRHWVGGIIEGKPVGVRPVRETAWVEISQEGGGFFLFHFDAKGECIADTWHQSLDEAKRQAEFEFGVLEDEWKQSVQNTSDTKRLVDLDKAHVWHPFTPMKQWRENEQIVIEAGEGPYLIDTDGRRYIDGVSSLWCNVLGHRVPEIDAAIVGQLGKIAHSTLLGLGNVPSIELAARLVRIAPGAPAPAPGSVRESDRGVGGVGPGHGTPSGRSVPPGGGATGKRLNKVFYSDAGATALEVAFKMAVGYWHHKGKPGKTGFIGLAGAYHGDTVGAMSVGYSELFHKPFVSMVFPVRSAPVPDALRASEELWSLYKPGMGAGHVWPSECKPLAEAMKGQCLAGLEQMLKEHGETTAAIVIEPVMQGAAGMVCQPSGFVKAVASLAEKYGVLLIADEVAVGFGRTGRLFACEHEGVTPDILCVAKGITGGYLPLAATLATDEVEGAFCGELSERKTLFHGHTYTGNPLAAAAANATIDLIESSGMIAHSQVSAQIVSERLTVLRDPEKFGHVIDVRQRGLMVGIELGKDRKTREPFDFAKRTGAAVCMRMRPKGLIIRPLGDVLVLMPMPGMAHDVLHRMMDVVVETIGEAGEK
jgi:adenosylmethionine-8-amino-7-oxononanoate aminotransferase